MKKTELLMLAICVSAAVSCGSRSAADKKSSSPESDGHDAFSTTKAMTLSYPGSDIAFSVTVKNDTLYIIPSGLSVSNPTLIHDITGYSFINAETADLNTDGYPELFVYLQSEGSGSYGRLVGYSANGDKSVSQIYLPELSDDPEAGEGYMGHDEMAVVENTFCRRFPVYREGDTNASPSGGMRQVHYKLVDGEAGRILKADRIIDFQ